MPKAPKSNSTRKPPVPAADHGVFDDWLGQTMPAVHPMLIALDELIRETIPDLEYSVKWAKMYYGLAELGWIIEMAGYHKSANMVFHGGADFDPPPPLGTTDRTRYYKLTTVEEAISPQMRNWIKQAATLPGWI